LMLFISRFERFWWVNSSIFVVASNIHFDGDGSWRWIHPKLCSFFFWCVFGGFLLKSHSNLLFLTPQIFDNGRVLPGSRLQVKTSRADEGPCVARLWLVQPWMLICSLVDPVPRSRLKKNWVKDWTRDTLHL
jgi:hypothetical protein